MRTAKIKNAIMLINKEPYDLIVDASFMGVKDVVWGIIRFIKK